MTRFFAWAVQGGLPTPAAAHNSGAAVIATTRGFPVYDRNPSVPVAGSLPVRMKPAKIANGDCKQVIIDQRVYRADFDTPKTSSSVRTIAIPPTTANQLAGWMELVGRRPESGVCVREPCHPSVEG